MADEILLIVAALILPVAESSVIVRVESAPAPASSILIVSAVPETGPAFKLTVKSPSPFVIPMLVVLQ